MRDGQCPALCAAAVGRSTVRRKGRHGGDIGRSGLMPDLVVEILSPSNRRGDLDRKRHLYARAGVREYWPVDLRARDIAVLVRRSGRFEALPQQPGVVRSAVLPGFEVVLAELFKGFERFVSL